MKSQKIVHPGLKKWVADMEKLCQPQSIFWMDGSKPEKRKLEKKAVQEGTLVPLNKKWPGCFYHRSDPNDVARVENLTFICSKKKSDAGPTNNWMAPKKAYQRAARYFKGSMKGKTMYVIPFSMGRPNSPFAKIGVEITDSVYVALNMRIMTTVGRTALRRLGKNGKFTKCLHSVGDLDIRHRLILHFPEDNAIWSVGSGYGGNALLGKKCMALRIASAQAKKEGWFAEHMLITGIEDPKGKIHYVAAAFPSACGKTNLAMIKPPKEFQRKGWKTHLIGDDIAWLRVGKDGALYAMNPETGFFGVAPGTNSKTNPRAVQSLKKNSIFTNVLITSQNAPWWEDGDGPLPKKGVNWKGLPWKPGAKGPDGKPMRAAHPNSRFTTPIEQCPIFSKKFYDPKGVKLSAIIFGGRHSRLAPLVYQSRDWTHGVYVGATVSSERTAASVGKLGEVRRDPMAMIPFCGYNMGDYFSHWIKMGKKIKKAPKIFHVNWFRKNSQGKFLWPGFGENFRILEWILGRTQGKAKGKETPLGVIPRKEDVNLKGLSVSVKDWALLFDMDEELWKADLMNQKKFFKKFGTRAPKILEKERKKLEKTLSSRRPI